DGGFAHEKFAQGHREQIETLLSSAETDQKLIAVLDIAYPDALDWQTAAFHQERLANWTPKPWVPNFEDSIDPVASISSSYDTVWFSDGLEYGNQRLALLDVLQDRGTVEIRAPSGDIGVLQSVSRDGDELIAKISFSNAPSGVPNVVFRGLTPSGARAEFARLPVSRDTLTAAVSLPAELSARLTDIVLEGEHHSGAIVHVSDYLARPRVGLFSIDPSEEVAELLQPLHYLRTALRQNAEIVEQSLDDILLSKPAAIFVTDVSRLPNEADLVNWVTNGGTLVQFAGPTTALNAVDLGASELMPVRLRQGGRQLGGAMTWETPKQLAPFSRQSPFFGLEIPDDIVVNAQVLAEPDADLSSRVIAELSDGTPLVTRMAMGDGQVVFFHITANADWSNLALSELFIDMSKRLVSRALALDSTEIPDDMTWKSVKLIDHVGALIDPAIPIAVSSEQLMSSGISAEVPGGMYTSDDFTIARNIGAGVGDIRPMKWPADVTVQVGGDVANALPLAQYIFVVAVFLLMADVIASARVAGRLVLMAACIWIAMPDLARAQDELSAASEITFAHVLTGDPRLDQMARSGLFGLSDALFFRTSVEPSLPVGVDAEFDELAYSKCG
ncbi:MAG: LytTR family transcriptional regulator, partial [Rhodobacteraceae bacterium]|nr:LytTR family transcriptional regulator [Paracoccaceae bacterium]